jgi:hypothetical protein
MDRAETVRKIGSLLRIESDAADAYEHALKYVDLPAVRERLEKHRDDHRRHIDAFTRLIREFDGATSGGRSHPLREFVTRGTTMIEIKCFVSVRSVRDTEAALLAVKLHRHRRRHRGTPHSGVE